MPAPFEEEEVTNYEIGWKAGLRSQGHLRTQLNAYYNEYEQVPGHRSVTRRFRCSASSSTCRITTKMHGFEAQARGRIRRLLAQCRAGLLNTELGNSSPTIGASRASAPCNPANRARERDLHRSERSRADLCARSFTFNLGAQYDFALGSERPDHAARRLRTRGGAVGDVVRRTQRAAIARGAQHLATRRSRGSTAASVTTLYGANLTDQHYVGALNCGLRCAGSLVSRPAADEDVLINYAQQEFVR